MPFSQIIPHSLSHKVQKTGLLVVGGGPCPGRLATLQHRSWTQQPTAALPGAAQAATGTLRVEKTQERWPGDTSGCQDL